jgi:hypothetical protein
MVFTYLDQEILGGLLCIINQMTFRKIDQKTFGLILIHDGFTKIQPVRQNSKAPDGLTLLAIV